MGEIHVHEFISLDGVIDTPVWTFEYGFEPQMAEALATVTGASRGILLGRRTYEMFEPAWSVRTADDDPGYPLTAGSGPRLFSEGQPATTWQLAVSETYENGVVYLSYRQIKQTTEGG